MIYTRLFVFIIIVGASVPVYAAEAPANMRQFNVTCPASKLLPVLDKAYHECSNGFVNGSCEKFVETFRQLLPEFDCQRSFDATLTKNYIVPAIWLAGDGALEDYVRLLMRMALKKDKMFADKWFQKASSEAKNLFGSSKFRAILDGHLAEEYMPLSHKAAEELQKKEH